MPHASIYTIAGIDPINLMFKMSSPPRTPIKSCKTDVKGMWSNHSFRQNLASPLCVAPITSMGFTRR